MESNNLLKDRIADLELRLAKQTTDNSIQELVLNNPIQTPITPESLKAIGFEKEDTPLGNVYVLRIGEIEIIHDRIYENKFWVQTNETEPDLFFHSTEQILDWLKPFTKGGGKWISKF